MRAKPKKHLQQSLPSLRRLLRRLWPYMRRQRGLIAGSMIALFLGVALRLLEPWPLKIILDSVIQLQPETTGTGRFTLPQSVEALPPETLAALAALAVVLLTGSRALMEYVNVVSFARIGNRVLAMLRNDLFGHIQRLGLPYHGASRGGDLVIRVLGDVNMLRDAASTALLPLLANALVFAGMWAVMFWLQWKLAALAMLILPLLWLRTITMSKRIRDTARQQRHRQGEMAAVAGEALTGIKTVQALSLEDRFSLWFNGRSEDAQKQDVKGAKLAAALGRSVDVLLAVATGLVLWQGTRLVLQQQLSAGELVVFLTYLRRAYNPVQDFAKYASRLAKAAAAGERVLDVLDREPGVEDAPDAVEAPSFRGHVVLDNVSFAYDPHLPVLDRLNLEVHAGEWVALVGPSGIGKSTLANLILRLHDPDDGRILIDGVDIRRYTLSSLRAQIAVVLQDGQLFALSAHDNIAVGRPDCSEEQVIAATHLANAHNFITAMPQGYETILSERGASLSGGQRQRMAIARAALRDAPVLILDEPSSGLDKENEQTVINALQRLAAGRTTLLITHDLSLASRADRIIYLNNGRVFEAGSHDQLLHLNGRYAEVFRMQSTSRAHGADWTDAEGKAESHAVIA